MSGPDRDGKLSNESRRLNEMLLWDERGRRLHMLHMAILGRRRGGAKVDRTVVALRINGRRCRPRPRHETCVIQISGEVTGRHRLLLSKEGRRIKSQLSSWTRGIEIIRRAEELLLLVDLMMGSGMIILIPPRRIVSVRTKLRGRWLTGGNRFAAAVQESLLRRIPSSTRHCLFFEPNRTT